MATILMRIPSHELVHLGVHDHSEMVSWTLTEEAFVNQLLLDATLHGDDVLETTNDSDSTSYSTQSCCYSPMPIQKPCNASKTSLSTVTAMVSAPWAPLSSERTKRKQKRQRMGDEERKARHRNVQREFMKRKRARISVLRPVVSHVEKQLRLATVLQEIELLTQENEALTKQCEGIHSAVAATRLPRFFLDDKGEKTLVFSLPTEETHDSDITKKIADFEWDEILDLLSL